VDRPPSPPPALHFRGGFPPPPAVDALCAAAHADDIFPPINIPVVSVVWQYTGLSATDIEQRLVYNEERALTTTVNNIEHIESTSYDSFGVIKVFFQPGVSPDGAVAEVTAISQTILRQLPPERLRPSSSNTTPRPFRFYSTASAASPSPSSRSLIFP